MADNPIVLAVRFLLELTALFALGYWGWTQHMGALRVILTILLPLLAAAVWAIFRVPGFPNDAPVPVPGLVRLLLEAIYFGGAVWALYASGHHTWGLILAIVVIVHYVVSYDYIIQLLAVRA